MSNNNSQENSKTFKQAVDLLANILVGIIDNAGTDNIDTFVQKDIIKVSKIKKNEKRKYKANRKNNSQ